MLLFISQIYEMSIVYIWKSTDPQW